MNYGLKFGRFFGRLHEKLFYLLIFLLPVQLGKHFWPGFSFVFGIPIDYLSPTVYLTDILVIGILLSWGMGKNFKTQISKLKSTCQKSKPFLIFFFCFLLLNLFFSQNKEVSAYYWCRFLEFFLLGCYIARSNSGQKTMNRVLPWVVIYSSLIGIGQSLKQASLGGIFWWLGERTFTFSTVGIAKGNLNGRLFFRPYGIFSHPNVLAGFTLVSLVLIAFNSKKKRFSPLGLSLVLGAFIVILSFSRLAWCGMVLAIFLFFLEKRFRTKEFFLGALVMFSFLFLFFFKVGFDPFSVSRRLELARSAILMMADFPLFGVGLGNFVLRLPYFWQETEGIRFIQPVHNVFLLIGAETGLIGLIGCLWFLFRTLTKIFQGKKRVIFYSLFFVLFLGFFDHYWLTLQQGQLLLTLVLGLAYSRTWVGLC